MLNYEVFRNHIICIIGSVEPPFHVFFFSIVNEVGTHVFCSIRYCNDEYFLKFHEIDRLILYKYEKYKLIQ